MIADENTIRTILQVYSNAKDTIDVYGDFTSALSAIEIEEFKKVFLELKNKRVKVRWITEITKDNLSYCKMLMEFADVRHLDGIRGTFGVTETEYIATTTLKKDAQPTPQQLNYNNIKGFVEQQRYLFDIIWSKAGQAEQKIREIEEGVEAEVFEVIIDNQKAIDVFVNVAKSAQNEVLMILANSKALVTQYRLGILKHLVNISNKKGAVVKIICPLDEKNAQIVKYIIENAPNIKILEGNNSYSTIIIVDNQKFFRAEIKGNDAKELSDGIAFAVYSNRKPGVNSFKSFFELLWQSNNLNVQLKITDKMHKEFINIAAHELRTPIQPILGLSEILRSGIKDKDTKLLELVDIIIKNTRRLQRLSDQILDITQIESQLLKLNRQQIDLNDIISSIIQNYKAQIQRSNHNVNLLYKVADNNAILIEADRDRISQVISNLLSNAIKFSQDGTITILTRKGGEDGKDIIIVDVKDSGLGIDPEILPRLFSKFATTSFEGTGLGLFISKSIIEAHGGKMWAENNKDGKGSTFSFSLPLSKQSQYP